VPQVTWEPPAPGFGTPEKQKRPKPILKNDAPNEYTLSYARTDEKNLHNTARSFLGTIKTRSAAITQRPEVNSSSFQIRFFLESWREWTSRVLPAALIYIPQAQKHATGTNFIS
jgi:hypothetical protein